MGYFLEYECTDKATIISSGGKVVENDNGTVSVFIDTGGKNLHSLPMTKSCCEKLDPSYTFDVDKQKCRWSADGQDCLDIAPFKLVLNPIENDGAIFVVDTDNNEDCTLNISFDYLMQFDCADILNKIIESNNQSIGQSGTNYLQSQYDDCVTQQNFYEGQLFTLQQDLENTPYVIECKAGKLDDFGVDKQYCLTDLGLQQWEQILGTNNYNTWVNSNGTDTSVYSCTEVNQLVNLDNATNTLFFNSCGVEMGLRDKITKQISETQATLSKFNCDEILTTINELTPVIRCLTVTDILESFNVSMSVDLVDSDTGKLTQIYEEEVFNIGTGNLSTYLQDNQPNTGLIASGETGTTFCQNVAIQLMTELQEVLQQSGTTQIQDLVQNSFDSNWLSFNTTIEDQSILDSLYNEKIKISLKINECCVDFSILVDRIKLNSDCTKLDSQEVRVTKSPSFDMVRVLDNKKSWLSNEDSERREFDLRFRDTQYDINNYKLAINSKEVDLDINPANAIEQDLFCYVSDNNCILTGTTEVTGTTCGDNGIDLTELMSTDISEITSLKEFTDTLKSELINVKGWKTMSSHPTLRLLYDRYMNSTDYCDMLSSQFDYCTMMEFSELVGTYWVDLIEQVVPSTTIWGSTYVYGNTLFDQQKFTYKKYSLLPCKLPNSGGGVVSPTTGWTSDVDVELEELQNDPYYDTISGSTTGQTFVNVTYTPSGRPAPLLRPSCEGVGIIQMNCGSEFVGRIVNYGTPNNDGIESEEPSTGDISITECAISVEIGNVAISKLGYSAHANTSGDIVGPVSYLWSNGETSQTAINLQSGQTYTVTVYDNGIDGCSETASVTI